MAGQGWRLVAVGDHGGGAAPSTAGDGAVPQVPYEPRPWSQRGWGGWDGMRRELVLGAAGACPRQARPCGLRVGVWLWSDRGDDRSLGGWLNTQRWKRAAGANGFLKHPSAAGGEAGSAASHARAEARSVSSAGLLRQSPARSAATFNSPRCHSGCSTGVEDLEGKFYLLCMSRKAANSGTSTRESS